MSWTMSTRSLTVSKSPGISEGASSPHQPRPDFLPGPYPASRDVAEAPPDRRHRFRVGHDLDGLLPALEFVRRHDHDRGPPSSRDEYASVPSRCFIDETRQLLARSADADLPHTSIVGDARSSARARDGSIRSG